MGSPGGESVAEEDTANRDRFLDTLNEQWCVQYW
jgi:hypothetical protein